MKRMLPWAIVAFYPLIALTALNLVSARENAYLVYHSHVSSPGALVTEYWWPFLVVTDICATAFFVVSVLQNRVLSTRWRILWAVGVVLLGVVVMPVYWWRHSERAAR
jgi:hypothetical protein